MNADMLNQIVLGRPYNVTDCLNHLGQWCMYCSEDTDGPIFCGACGKKQETKTDMFVKYDDDDLFAALCDEAGFKPEPTDIERAETEWYSNEEYDTENENEFVCVKCSFAQPNNWCYNCDTHNICERCYGYGEDDEEEEWVCYCCARKLNLGEEEDDDEEEEYDLFAELQAQAKAELEEERKNKK
jgi:hypothetical protein